MCTTERIDIVTKWSPLQDIFKCSPGGNVGHFDANFSEIWSAQLKTDHFGSCNGIAPNRRQAIAWSNGGLVHDFPARCVNYQDSCLKEKYPTHFDQHIEVETKWPLFSRHFQMQSLEWKCMNFDYEFNEVCSWGSNWQYPSIYSDNGLAPFWRQAIVWINNGLVYWRIYRPQWVK